MEETLPHRRHKVSIDEDLTNSVEVSDAGTDYSEHASDNSSNEEHLDEIESHDIEQESDYSNEEQNYNEEQSDDEESESTNTASESGEIKDGRFVMSIVCNFNGVKAPQSFIIGYPEENHHPIHFQSNFIAKNRGGNVPPDMMESIQKLYDLSKKNGVDFLEICKYAISAANGDKQ
jgi:hypothetical protein